MLTSTAGATRQDRAMATARIGIGLALLLDTHETWSLLRRVADGSIALPWFDAAPGVTALGTDLLSGVALAAALAIVLGWRVAWAAGVTVGTCLTFLMWDQQTYSSHRLLVTILALLLVFARSDRAWSWRPISAPASPWPAFLMMTQVSVCYLFAGLSKVNTTYLPGQALNHWLRWDLPVLLTFAMAIGSVLTEVSIAVLLWTRHVRLALLLGACLHVSIVVGMREHTLALLAFGLTCAATYPLFIVRSSSGRERGDPGPAPIRSRILQSSG